MKTDILSTRQHPDELRRQQMQHIFSEARKHAIELRIRAHEETLKLARQ